MQKSIKGMVKIELTCADIPAALSFLQEYNLDLFEVRQVDELTAVFQVQRKDEKLLLALLKRKGIQAKIINKAGLFWSFRALIRRPVLVLGLMIIIFAGTFLPSRIFFFRVEGNSTLPSRLILETAAECGISFGASRKDVRSEKMKNALLEKIPMLQWAGVNTSGCVATICVKERQAPIQSSPQTGVSSIIAGKDGVICDMTVTQGSPVCKIGQAVSEGQVLVSGYTNCEQSIRATRAKGEIYAATGYQISLIMPSHCEQRGLINTQYQKYSLIFGKKRINFYQDSGILDSSCVKMYEEKYVTLPGGFELPVAFVTETYIIHQQSIVTSTAESSAEILSSLAQRYLKDHMIAGRICSQTERYFSQDGIIGLSGEYGCIEMIALERNEEILKP